MINTNRPEGDNINALCRYYVELHDELSRRFENLDISDLNYTTAEMIRGKKGGGFNNRDISKGGGLYFDLGFAPNDAVNFISAKGTIYNPNTSYYTLTQGRFKKINLNLQPGQTIVTHCLKRQEPVYLENTNFTKEAMGMSQGGLSIAIGRDVSIMSPNENDPWHQEFPPYVFTIVPTFNCPLASLEGATYNRIYTDYSYNYARMGKNDRQYGVKSPIGFTIHAEEEMTPEEKEEQHEIYRATRLLVLRLCLLKCGNVDAYSYSLSECEAELGNYLMFVRDSGEIQPVNPVIFKYIAIWRNNNA